jgi:hypothetical protein
MSQETIDELSVLDVMFDWETHGARLSMASAVTWLKGREPLAVVPEFVEQSFALFMNRYCEVAWMVHRLLPLLQPPTVVLSDVWKEKWRTVDQAFETVVHSVTVQLGKPIGAAMVELVRTKFPFDESSSFPL